jgi:hypothetical protein
MRRLSDGFFKLPVRLSERLSAQAQKGAVTGCKGPCPPSPWIDLKT